MEKKTEARDNGFALFKYLKENRPEVNVYYVITKKSPDLERVKKYGDVVYYKSLKHYLYYLCSSANISSQQFGAGPGMRDFILKNTEPIRRKNQRVIFLQHGITKDGLSHKMDHSAAKFDLFVTSAKREYDFIRQYFGYPEENVRLLGMCRFDNLLEDHRTEKIILVMPTHRSWLHICDSKKEANAKNVELFKESGFYKTYYELLTDDGLISFVKNAGYKICFYPHYAMQPYIKAFNPLNCDTVVICDRGKFDVQKLLMSSAVLVTDYSSVFFDFAYMKKPVVYYQFDEKQFRDGQYKKGYFDYREDGFGPVCSDKEQLKEEIVKLLKNDCSIENTYVERIDSFFTIRDGKNCERTYNAIIDLLRDKIEQRSESDI